MRLVWRVVIYKLYIGRRHPNWEPPCSRRQWQKNAENLEALDRYTEEQNKKEAGSGDIFDDEETDENPEPISPEDTARCAAIQASRDSADGADDADEAWKSGWRYNKKLNSINYYMFYRN